MPNPFAGSPFKQSPGAARRTTRTPKPEPKPRYGAVGRGADTTTTRTPRQVVSPDRADDRAARRKRQIARSRSASPDRQDTKRAPEQLARDAEVVAKNVRDSRRKVVTERGRGAGPRFIKKALHDVVDTVYGPGGVNRNNVVTPKEAAKLRAQGRKVRDLTPRESMDVGATIGVKSIGGGSTALTRMPMAVALGIAKDPKVAIPATLKGLRDMVTGAPAGVVKAITDPGGTLKDTAKDYKRRYKDINEPGGVSKTADRISKEGAAPELADLTSIGVPAGKALDLALGAGARAGKLGARLEEATQAARPRMRTTGGEAREQTRSKTLSGALRENRRDRQAREALGRDVHEADGAAAAAAVRDVEGLPADEGPNTPLSDARRTKGEVDAVTREAFNRGEVVPTRHAARPGRRVVSDRQLRKAQQQDYAGRKGRGLHEQRTEQREEIFHGANKTLAALNPNERRAFKTAMQTGAITPAAGLRAVKRRIAMIEQARKTGKDTGNLDVDELPTLQRIAADPRKHFTPRLERAVRIEMERGARVGEGDPSLGTTATERAERAESRRLAPSAELFNVRRKGTPVNEAMKTGEARVAGAAKKVTKAERAHAQASRRATAARAYTQAGIDRMKREANTPAAKAEHEARVTQAKRAVEIHERAAANHEARAGKARQPGTRDAHLAKARAARQRARKAKQRLRHLEHRDKAMRPEYRKVVARTKGHEAAAKRELDRATQELLTNQQALGSVRRQKNAGAQLIGAEPIKDFKGRVRAARPDGFTEPGYFPSVRRAQTRFAPFTIGGARKVKGDAKYQGKLFRAGREDNKITTYTQKLAQGIKRKHNWKLVADTIDAHAFEWGKGLKYGEALDELAKRGIDPLSVKLIDMDAFDSRAARAGDEGGALHVGTDPEHELYEALSNSTLDTKAVDRAAALDPSGGRLLVMPKHVGDEILADTKPSGVFGRGLDILKGKSARVMLGLSPAWLQFQVAANVIQTAMATKSLPGEWLYANAKWWKGLNDTERKALEPYVGIGAFHDAIEQPHMGAAAQGGLVNAYRAFKAHDFWHAPRKGLRGASVSQLNPLDTLFRLDNAQNNFFRKAVLYNRLKREAFDRMGKSMAVHQRIVDKTIGKTGTDASAMIRSLIHDRAALEAGAESVKDFLGDYMTYTAKERKTLSRNIMFYGYLRFSLRFTFYTMPVKHPVMSAILGQLGGINAREVRDLLGGDELPWALGKVYWTKNGKLREVDLSRANPFMNAVTQAKIPEKGAVRGLLQSAVGFLPPMIGSAANIAFAKSLYKDRAYKVDGESTARPNKKGDQITDSQAARIFGREMLGLVALYRMEEKARADGRPISDDSILGLHERYTGYKDPLLAQGVRKAQRDTSPGKLRREALLPLFPRDSRDPETAAKIRRATGKTAAAGSSAAAAGAPAVDDATMKLLDSYATQAAGASSPDLDELSRLMKAYAGG